MVPATAFQPVIDAITAQISISTVVGVVAAGVGLAIGFVFMWWGGRKLVRMLMGAFKKGKLGI